MDGVDGKSREEIVNEEGQEIMDAEEGKSYLEKVLLTIPGQEFTLEALSNALLHLTQYAKVKKEATTVHALRSIAFILTETIAINSADKIQAKIEECVQTQIEHFKRTTDDMAIVTVDVLEKAIEKATQGLVAKTTEAALEIQSATNLITDTSTKMTSATTTYKEALEKQPAPAPMAPATQNIANILDPKAKAREGIMARQVLIDIPLEISQSTYQKMSNSAILDKANNAISIISKDTIHKFLGVTKLRNGGLLMELNSEEANIWLRLPTHISTFTFNFDITATIKTRTYSVIVRFVPLTFDPDSDTELREIEEISKLDNNTIIKARYVKPKERRAPGQITGHVIINFNAPEQANHAIVHGLVICQKRVTAEKCKKEPIRCLKCQGYDHMAHECISTQDTCGTCGHYHRTSGCSQTNQPWCSSCNVNGHPSWARDCPTFIAKCQQMDNRMHENRLPYYPTDEQWSQQSTPPTQEPYQPTNDRAWKTQTKGKRQWEGQTNYKQSTIDFARNDSAPHSRPKRPYAPATNRFVVERSPAAGPSNPYANLNSSVAKPYATNTNKFTVDRTPTPEPTTQHTQDDTNTPSPPSTTETSGEQNE